MNALALAGAVAVSVSVGACSDDDAPDPMAFCEAATETERFATMFDGLDPADVEGAIETFSAARETEEELRSLAPEAVQSDIGVIIRFLDDVLEGLRSPEATAGERPPIYDELRPRFDQVEAASDRIELYVSTNC